LGGVVEDGLLDQGVFMESLIDVTMRSIWISSAAGLLAFATGFPISFALAGLPRRRFEFFIGVFEILIGVPTTVIGLLLYMLIYPKGPLGPLGLLYTPQAVMLGEFLVALPVAVTLTARHVYELKAALTELVLGLGGSENQVLRLLARELTPILLSAYVASFSRAIGELGAALIVGGGIEGFTNVLTTAIYLETSIGDYEQAIQLGLVLIGVVAVVAVAIKALGVRGGWRLG
jgi:tungstate transport system permease protein